MAWKYKDDKNRYHLLRYHNRRKFMFEYLGNKCAICGSTENLEIDHTDNLPDKIPLSKLWGISYDRLINELQKCQVLCKSCHTEKSISERGHNPGGKHGTPYYYKRYKCRCDLCVEANRKYAREYKRKRKARQQAQGPFV